MVASGQRKTPRSFPRGVPFLWIRDRSDGVGHHLDSQALPLGVLFLADHAGNGEEIDEDPDERNDGSDDADRQQQLRHAGTGATEVETVGTEHPEEDQQKIGDGDARAGVGQALLDEHLLLGVQQDISPSGIEDALLCHS